MVINIWPEQKEITRMHSAQICCIRYYDVKNMQENGMRGL